MRPQCAEGVKIAPLPPPILKSLASPGLLAPVAVATYQEALPLTEERLLKRIGVELLATWRVRLGP